MGEPNPIRIKYLLVEPIRSDMMDAFSGDASLERLEILASDYRVLTSRLPHHKEARDIVISTQRDKEGTFEERKYYVGEFGKRFVENIWGSGPALGSHVYTPEQVAAMREQAKSHQTSS